MGDATNVPKGPFTRWHEGGYEGWNWTDYQTLEAAVTAATYSSGPVVITRPVPFKIIAIEEDPSHV